MCGIAGFTGWEGSQEAAQATLQAMCTAITHRGPDEEGTWLGPGVALGMRRLSVIDIAGGSQPVRSEDGSVRVVFNGEIYNHHALRDALAHAHVLRSRSDTEVLAHLYEERGDALVHELRGMFAFAVWDERRQRLLLARDRLGIKPLYYWAIPGGVAFASELRALLACPEFPAHVSAEAVQQYLSFGYVPDPLSIFEGVRKLPPGHLLTWDRSTGIQLHRYWTPARAEVAVRDEREAIEELRRLLSDAVSSHLESDVPLGAFLSGGIDSSTVVAHMSRALSRPVRTFSIGFEEREFDESQHAAQVARALGTQHTELILRPDADAWTESVIHVFDEPFGDSSAIPTLLVSQLARQQVTVALSGDGGDELFAGYERYAESLGQLRPAPAPVRRLLRAAALRLPHSAPGRNRLLDLARTRRGRYATTVAMALPSSEGGVVSDAMAVSALSLDTTLDRWFRETGERDFPTQMMLVDLQSYLPGDILTKVDRASMSVSLEARVPLLDHHLVEFAVSLPSHLKQRDDTSKWILRQAVADVVPPSVLSRRKQGFAVPLRHWFRRELRYRIDSMTGNDSFLAEYVSLDRVRQVVREHMTHRRDHSHLLWRLLVLDVWLRGLRSGTLARTVPQFPELPAGSSLLARAG